MGICKNIVVDYIGRNLFVECKPSDNGYILGCGTGRLHLYTAGIR